MQIFRKKKSHDGFTLVELMFVIVILAIIILIWNNLDTFKHRDIREQINNMTHDISNIITTEINYSLLGKMETNTEGELELPISRQIHISFTDTEKFIRTRYDFSGTDIDTFPNISLDNDGNFYDNPNEEFIIENIQDKDNVSLVGTKLTKNQITIVIQKGEINFYSGINPDLDTDTALTNFIIQIPITYRGRKNIIEIDRRTARLDILLNQ